MTTQEALRETAAVLSWVEREMRALEGRVKKLEARLPPSSTEVFDRWIENLTARPHQKEQS